ncbi:MAG: coproporphyrinogen III oxidase, partial [Lachnoclostridium sp.]|jgi:oxygen-independent coproporphyrinogen-3 oxidase|nr:coproporphyrinogen III oxidase [Lachnoclostridium sp.]
MSIYNLTLEPETPFYRKYNDAPYMDEFENYELYCQAREWMKKVDIDRYEISNYAKPGYECQHNLKYWSGQSYLGFGLGASSVVDNAQWKKTDDLYEYLRMPHVRKDLKWLDKSERMENYIIFGLRKVKGISFKEFHNIFGIDLNVMFDKQINKYYNERLMITDGRRLYLTEKGCDVSNVILQDFLM